MAHTVIYGLVWFAVLQTSNCRTYEITKTTVSSVSPNWLKQSTFSPKEWSTDYSTKVPLSTTTESDLAPEWGGSCTKKHWTKCSKLDRWVTSYYVNVKKPELGFKYHEMDCKLERPICLKNGYTVTRCQLLCMRCNKEFLSKYDKYVAKEGECLHD